MQMQTAVVVLRCNPLPCEVHTRATRQAVQISLGRLAQEDKSEKRKDAVHGIARAHSAAC